MAELNVTELAAEDDVRKKTGIAPASKMSDNAKQETVTEVFFELMYSVPK